MLTLILSFIAGFLSVLAPCVLPLLPIIVGGSLTGENNKKRPYIIAASLVTSLLLFTLLLKVSTAVLGVSSSTWSNISGFIVILLGLAMLYPEKWDLIIGRLGIQARSQRLLGKAGQSKNGTLSAILTGLALGPVFSSCSPMYAWVIATVLPDNSTLGILYLAAYCIGLAFSLLGIALLGQKMVDRIKWMSDPHGAFQKIIAVIFIVVGFLIFFGIDKDIQTYFLKKDFINIKVIEEKLVPES